MARDLYAPPSTPREAGTRPSVAPTYVVRLEDGLAARVRTGGAGPILWLHGYTLDSSTWEPLWDHLPQWSHVGIDLPGHGASESSPPGEGLPELAERIGRLAVTLGIRHLIALSFGTMLAVEIAGQLPWAFDTLTLGAPALAGGPRDPAARARYRDLLRLYHQAGPGPRLRDLWLTSPPDIFTHARRQPELFHRLQGVVGRHPWTELADGRSGLLADHTQDDLMLGRIRATTLVLVGEHEMPAFRACAARIRDAVPGSRVVTVPDVGHLCLLEAPRLVCQLIEAHLGAVDRVDFSVASDGEPAGAAFPQ